LAAAALAAAAAVCAQLVGGALKLSAVAVVAGGSTTTGGTMHMISSIGGHGVPMSGGGYSLMPGTLSAVKTARPDASLAHCYPTPFVPSRGDSRITFSDLPAQAKIVIYTIAGRVVKTLYKDDTTDSLVWDPVASESGEQIASGVYPFVVIQSNRVTKRGKLMVVK
ncbi:MAG: T9SS type A sorting domain-containing protein, partial [Elusimicrobia bacterium]|nr:T9SS type A sorting domain-containing protein [Elusimicrobiota bacterium]